MSSFVQLHSLLQAADLLTAPLPTNAIAAEWTPFFSTGILISRSSWLGRIIGWMWNIADFCKIGSETSLIKKIIDTSHHVFESILHAEKHDEPAIQQCIALTYLPQWNKRIEQVACTLLGCTKDTWQKAIKNTQKKISFELFCQMTLLPPPIKALQDMASCNYVKERARWIDEIKKALPFLDVQLALDGLEALFSEQEGSNQKAHNLAFELHKRGVALERLAISFPHKTPISSNGIRVPDPRCTCIKSQAMPEYMLMLSSHGFILPFWRIYAAEHKTLFKVINCYKIDSTEHQALVESVEGPLKAITRIDFPYALLKKSAIDALCFSIHLWLQSRLSFHPHADDIWVTPSAELVTFVPTVVQETPFTLTEIETFVHKVLQESPPGLKKIVLERSGFYAQHEIRVIIKILEETGLIFRPNELAKELAWHGISDKMLLQSIETLLIHIQQHIQTIPHNHLAEYSYEKQVIETYFTLARQEGCFFFPSAEVLHKLTYAMSSYLTVPETQHV